MARRSLDPAELDMTPMIDVTFQLIIFFVVTIQMAKNYREDIELEDSPHGPEIKSGEEARTLIVEVDKKGDIWMSGVPLNRTQFKNIMITRYRNFGEFPVLIRGDKRTKHEDIRKVMDTCSGVGIWRINFAAIKERKEL